MRMIFPLVYPSAGTIRSTVKESPRGVPKTGQYSGGTRSDSVRLKGIPLSLALALKLLMRFFPVVTNFIFSGEGAFEAKL